MGLSIRQTTRLLRTSRGFTLVEAMVVVVIALILVGLGYSGFSSQLKREQATAAATQLMGHIKEAKMLTMEKHVSHGVDVTGNVYTIFRDNDNSCSLGVNEPIVHQVNVAQDFGGVTVSGSTRFRFDTRGMPRSATGGFAAVGVNLTMAGKRQCTLTMTNVGRVAVACQDL